MEDARNIFKERYKRFLKSSRERISAEDLEREAEQAAELCDCDAYVDATDAKTCCMCADDGDVMPADGYILTDVAHETEAVRDRKIAGMESGIILPIVVPVCKKCRKRHIIVQYVPTLINVAVVALALFLTTNSAVKQKLFEANLFVPAVMRPFFLFAVITAVTVVLCSALRRFLIETYSTKTIFNPLKIKRLHFLEENGWQRLYRNRQFKFMFEKKLPEYMRDECGCAECCHEEPHTDDAPANVQTNGAEAEEMQEDNPTEDE